jgi:hypothetical protein
MKTIKLTKGYVAQVDDKDSERVCQHKWRALVHRREDGSIKNVYAVRTVYSVGKRHTQQLHRFILGVTDSEIQVDHSPDHSGLNCTRENLRLATNAENSRNQRLRIDNTSGIKGVTWHKARKKWQAQINVNGKKKYLGLFASKNDATQSHDSAAKQYFGAFALTNTMLSKAA